MYYKKYAYALAQHKMSFLCFSLFSPRKEKYTIYSLFSADTIMYTNSNFVLVLPRKI